MTKNNKNILNIEIETEVLIKEKKAENSNVDFNSKVILFNDEIHTFDEVINQIIKAINCSPDFAEKLTFEVHTKGKATIFEGEMMECIKVSNILEEIELHTQIEF
jgi:ATP-dependent Clp protease adapter protein ClpS